MDVAVGRRINARRAHPAVDDAYARLSNSANRSVLWFSMAGVLLLFGRRRAVLRGSGSLLVASIIANLIGKQIFGGDRPLLKDIPIGRQLKKYPTSPSFPSGHSASAAAFATGLALESPRVGLAVAPVAAAVAYSRLHVGAHWFSDVVGGSALGVAVASVGKLIVPGRAAGTGTRGPTREGGTEITLPALRDGDGAFIVANPSSGTSTLRPDPLAIVEERLPRARVHVLEDGDDLAGVVRDAVAAEPRPQVLGICGGDGSVAAVAQLARDAGLPLLVLPGGTFNHFARAAGLESVGQAIDALQDGEGLRADVATLGIIRGDGARGGAADGGGDPLTVLNTASVGVYPEFVATREKLEPNLGKWFAAMIAAVRVLRTAQPVDVRIDGRIAHVWSLYVGVNRNFPSTVAPLSRRRLDDGVLDVRILHAGSRPRAALSLAFGRRTSVILRRLLPGTSVIERFTTPAVSIDVRPRREASPDRRAAVGFAHDGEVSLNGRDGDASSEGYTARLHIVPGGLEVYSPAAR
jgi:undecaprenyl-diphosphatase